MKNSRRFRINLATTVVVTAPVLLAAAAHAQTAPAAAPAAAPAVTDDGPGLREIVVTGTKLGAQNLQRTPIAVSVVDSKLLKSQGLSTVQDIANYVPNLTFSRNTNQAVIYLRGIGSNNAGAGSDPSVTQQVDGVYIARPTAQIGDFLDVERIEVLRGPQGTLYGRNAVGGTVNIISTQPSSTFGGRIRVGYGNYNTNTAEAYVTGPISGDTLTASLAGTYRGHDAFFNNIIPGKHDVGSANRAGVRGQLRYAPSSDLNITLRADYSSIDEYMESYDHLLARTKFPSIANSLVGGYRDVALNTDQPLREKTGGVSLDINYKLGNGFSLKSITSWRKLYSHLYNDNDATDINAQQLLVVERQQQVTQEFNLNYDSSRFKAVGGLFFFGDKDFQNNTATIPPSPATPAVAASMPSAQPTIKTRSYAAFAQGNYELFDGLHIIAGIRYTYETKTMDQDYTRILLNPALPAGTSAPGFPVIFDAKRNDHAFTPKFGVDYQITPEAMIYASATRGFKSGGFNNAADVKATAGFNPEKLWAYEIGTKTQFFDHKLRINVSGFIYDYKDLQVRNLIGPGRATILNAASARIKGVEVETIFKPIPMLQFSANGSYLDARYRKFPAASLASAYVSYFPGATCTGAGPAQICTTNASGNRLESTPKWSGVVAVDLTPKLANGYALDLHVDYAWRGKVFFDASNLAISSQKAYGLLNANIGIGPQKWWKVEAYIRNATNKKYYQTISGSGIVPGAIAGDPRTFGVRLGYTF